MRPSQSSSLSAKQAPYSAVTMLALILTLTMSATFGLRAVLPLDALAPVVATMLFVLAATTGIVALLTSRHAPRTRMLDLTRVLTFVGVIVSIMIESDQMTRLMALSEHPE